jgi:hypothetical protein
LSSCLLPKNVKIKIQRTIILLIVLWGHETGFVTLRNEYRLKVFENRVQRGIFGLKGDEIIEGWRKLHNEQLHNLYFSPSIIRMMQSEDEMGSACSTHGEKWNVWRVSVGMSEGKRPLGRP